MFSPIPVDEARPDGSGQEPVWPPHEVHLLRPVRGRRGPGAHQAQHPPDAGLWGQVHPRLLGRGGHLGGAGRGEGAQVSLRLLSVVRFLVF